MAPNDLLELDDQRLVASVAAVVGVPRAEVTADRFSFVLHAPLELLARAALLPLVTPDARDAARERIAVLADEYEASGPPLPPPAAADFESLAAASRALVDATASGDAQAADSAAAWLGGRAHPAVLPGLLGDLFLPSLEAAGHANIYLALLPRYQPRGLPGQMLRHPVRAIANGNGRRVAVPPGTADGSGASILATLATIEPIEPGPWGIAPVVQHAEKGGVLTRFLAADGTFAAPARPPLELVRFAAQAMLQGPADHAPYGWSHALTLAQAPLVIAADHAGDPGTATFVATTYLAAHWAGYGTGRVDLSFAPEPVGVPIHEALDADPSIAAAAAFHAAPGPGIGAVAAHLATAASRNHDAHRVKYTLACLDAGTLDPPAQRLYLAAAAYLNAWWERHGDPDDPHPELAEPAANWVS